MLISFDTKSILLSLVRDNKKEKIIEKLNLIKINQLLGEGSGPIEFISQLISCIKSDKLAEVTSDFIKSDVHILNTGGYSLLWKYFKPKSKNKIITRIDGIGIDSRLIKTRKKIDCNILDLAERSNTIIYQSKFCKKCFQNIYNFEGPNRVINNGSTILPSKNKATNEINMYIKKRTKNGYFVIAGRNTKRKRILEIIDMYNRLIDNNMPKLVILSDIHESKKIKSNKLIYLGLQHPNIARLIINESIGLIHIDCYDWCPNLVISAIFDRVPVICSNYGGTPEIVHKSGYIINEFPNNLTYDIEGLKYALSSKIPDDLFKEALNDIYYHRINIEYKNNFSMSETAKKYIDLCLKVKATND